MRIVEIKCIYSKRTDEAYDWIVNALIREESVSNEIMFPPHLTNVLQLLQQIDVVDYHSFMNYWMIISRKDKRGWWMSRLDEKVVVGVSWSDKLEQDEEETWTSSTPVVSGQCGPATFLSDHAKHSNTYSPNISNVGKCINLCRQWLSSFWFEGILLEIVCRVWYH